MAEQATLEKIRERRLERMRQGQNACEIVPLPSDSEIRVALVPLTEAEYDACMRLTSRLDVPENVAGASIMDRHEKREVIIRASRETENLTQHVWKTVDEMMTSIEPEDVNVLYDRYVEMSTDISPHIAQLSEEEIDFLKDYFANCQWSDLSGKQLYALNRFISARSILLPSDNSLGSSSIT